MKVLIKPLITESSLAEAAKNRYSFVVNKAATKTEVKNAINKVFGVKVLKIQTITIRGKSYRTGRKMIMRKKADHKKAIVTIEKGKTIDLFEATKQDK
jgi:large subunit ribosomal protein L23